jgi:two-component system, chemotaxis family, chemotaxis protein CheY
VEAETGERVLEHIESASSKTDLIICDWQMNGMSGLRLFGELKTKKIEISFLMLTGSADQESIMEMKVAGVRGLLVKPISPCDLEAKVAALAKSGIR